jgi:transcriptional repressor NrdR
VLFPREKTYIQAMICPFCKTDNDKVVDSRVSGTSIRRRRECLACGRRFTTREYIELQPLTVIKRNGSKEPFQREKLMKGLMDSCKKRPVSREDLENLATNVENSLPVNDSFEVTYDQIGNMTMQELKKLDPVAYVRFASIYREFKEVGEFVDQIKNLDKS